MALQLILDERDIPMYDWGREINFKIYDENNNPYNCSFATGGAVLKTFDRFGNQIINDITVTWTNEAQGQGFFQYSNQYRPSEIGAYYVCVQMWDNAGPPPNEQISTGFFRITFTPQPSEF